MTITSHRTGEYASSPWACRGRPDENEVTQWPKAGSDQRGGLVEPLPICQKKEHRDRVGREGMRKAQTSALIDRNCYSGAQDGPLSVPSQLPYLTSVSILAPLSFLVPSASDVTLLAGGIIAIP